MISTKNTTAGRRLALIAVAATVLVSVLLNGLAMRHHAQLRDGTRRLLEAQVLALTRPLRQALRPRFEPGADPGSVRGPDIVLLEAWLESEDAAEVEALQVLGAKGEPLYGWRRGLGATKLPGDATPPLPEVHTARRSGPRAAPLVLERIERPDGALLYRATVRVGRPGGGPPRWRRGQGAAVGVRDLPGRPATLVVDLAPRAAAQLLGQGRLLVVGAFALSLGLWVLLFLLLRASRREASLREALAEGERFAEVGRLSGILAHQIRNPLAAIKGYAQLGLESTSNDAVTGRRLEHAAEEAARLEALTERLLRYVRPLTPQRRTVELAPLIHGLCESLDLPRADEASSGPTVQFALERSTALADPVLLREALAALINNALEACTGPMQAPIEIGSRSGKAGEVLIYVEDRGPGFAPGQFEQAVKPFHTTRTNGTGLGLALACRIAEAHGGHLALEDVQGGGARIQLVLSERPGLSP